MTSTDEHDDALDNTGDSDGDEKRTVQYLFNSPACMTSIMRRQLLQEMLKLMPEGVRDRVQALKNIQLDHLELEAKFYEEVHQLEKKYQTLYQPLHDKRKTIVTGEYEPTNQEKIYKHNEEEEELSSKMQDVSIEIRKNLKKQDYPEDIKGIPDFWLTIFRSTELLSTMIQEIDEPVMKQLVDVKVIYPTDDQMTFTLEFHFLPNEYFSNTVLTKQYFLKSSIEEEHPFLFEGPEIFKCTGCVIHWNKGKNLTVKTIRKKQKHKARGAVRTITKQVPVDSFFNFFNPPEPDAEDETDIDTQSILGTDYEIGHFLRSRVIPRAVLYYTGDIIDEDDDDYDEEEEEEEEDDEEDDSDDDGPAPPPGQKAIHGKKGFGSGGGPNHGAVNSKENPGECKQQ